MQFSNQILSNLPYVVAGLFCLAIIMRRRQVQKQRKYFEQQASRVGGRVESKYLGLYLALVFDHNGSQVSMRCLQRRKDMPRGTMVWAKVSTSNSFTLDLQKENVVTKYTKFLAPKDIELGNPEFDKNFIVHCSDESLARSILDPEVQSIITALDGKLKQAPLMRIVLGTLTLKTDYIPKAPEEYEALLDSFLAIFDHLSSRQVFQLAV